MNSSNSSRHVSRVSVHGGHSGQFCHHARDALEDVVQAYVDAGFSWVGITEHMPPPDDTMRYPDEVEDGLRADFLQRRFIDYFAECRALQRRYAGQIRLFAAFETETYPGSVDYVKRLMTLTQPDYIVGSVHHVGGFGIDVDREHYERAIAAVGGLEGLYLEYFDAQYAMMEELEPAVVGHFDLIRMFDDNYLETLQQPAVVRRIDRNLELIEARQLIMDFNLRGFDKTAEQFPSMPILRRALEFGVCVVPGDDSHGVGSVGRNYERGIDILRGLGHECRWREPRLLRSNDFC